MTLPTFPRRHPAPPETQEECDEAIAYWSAMSEMTGLPVTESDGSSTLDKLLELRPSLPNVKVPPPTAAADAASTPPETAEPQTLGGTPCSACLSVVAGRECVTMPIDGSVDLPKLLKRFQEIVQDLWTDLSMLKDDTMTLKVATSSVSYEQAQVMVESGFKEFVLVVKEVRPLETNA